MESSPQQALRSGESTSATFQRFTIFVDQSDAHASSLQRSRACYLRHSVPRSERVFWIVAAFVCPNRAQVRFSMFSMDRRRFLLWRRHVEVQDGTKTLSMTKRGRLISFQMSWGLKVHSRTPVQGSNIFGSNRRRKGKTGQNDQDGRIHYSSKLNAPGPLKPTAYWWGVMG